MIKIAECLHHIKELDASHCHIRDTSIIKLAELCPDIDSLSVNCCDYLTDSSIIRIADCDPNMKELNAEMDCKNNITFYGFNKIAACCQSIKILNAAGCLSIADKC
jgi:hypothetical protein